ncbi:DUF771 domain-containing protein [Paenibacillus radicis (ex Xue et al. 2023)]|uniref:DUF771 domain-containing protein n=1 Tax=Paenibacillus radicis (ex Xue et al. 2023) TaxID=2972489 RepID=A0ABT1YU11_9BACL|nr:DUF771 domain-containing protein [Paenibacillus radicis (ex Xue et al. 2023)]MCR8635773.1 DUF771 domain-containing protein [Paenibacillus radicis (ex Xue et al. 2023)]
MQQLTVKLSIPIPADSVLIGRVELEDLKRQELSGVYWSMQDLERRVSKGQVWIKENILYQPRFKKVLDVAHGGFVFYPKAKGQNWSFQASKMAEFLDKRFTDIFS